MKIKLLAAAALSMLMSSCDKEGNTANTEQVPSAKITVHVTVYGGNTIIREYDACDAWADHGAIYITMPGVKEKTLAQGTVIVEPIK